jgi:hypothetical protein
MYDCVKHIDLKTNYFVNDLYLRMLWHKIEPGDNTLLTAHERDYLFHADDSKVEWPDVLCDLYSIAYIDSVALTVFNMCDGTQTVRMKSFYESGDWYYLPLPDALRC